MAELTDDWARRIQAGDRRAIARAISGIENGDAACIPLLKKLFFSGRRARIIGVTGAPGAGKSTLVEKLAMEYARQGLRVGILAFDPTSPFSGGALLGDRIRMQSLSTDEAVYIRSMATRGHLGGLALAAQDAVTVLEAAGYEMILVETVGVGQDEVEVAGLADVTLLLLVPGMGDDVQTFKAGVMEIADVFVINKADHGGTDRLEREITAMIGLAPREDGWQPPILKTIATAGEGVESVRQALKDFRSYREQNSLTQRREREKWRARILAMLHQSLLDGIAGPQLHGGRIESHVEEVVERRRDPHSVVEDLIRDFKAGLG